MWVVDFRYIDTKISALFASMTLVYKAARRIHKQDAPGGFFYKPCLRYVAGSKGFKS